MDKSTEVSHFCESELNSFPTQMFKNVKSFVIFASAIQPRCDKHICELIFGTFADNRKVTEGMVRLRFYDRQWVRQRLSEKPDN